MMETKSEFSLGWECALEAVDGALKAAFTLGWDHHVKPSDILFDIHNTLHELKKLVSEQEVDNFLLGGYSVQENTQAQDSPVN